MELIKRKRIRIKDYDYSTSGAYFITVCTYNRLSILSQIVGQGLAPAEARLTITGEMVKAELLDLENRYQNVRVPKYVIMPNHIHAIIVLEETAAGASPCPTLSDIVCVFKSISARKSNIKLWQSSFYDHVIRDESDYLEIVEYIENNPAKWQEDKYFEG
ncbi:MAG: transposase [Clostridia bacterium]|nr:transposase [Clostridia bacterium]